MNQWRKGIASWKVGNTLYLSVPFTWLMADAEEMAAQHKGKVLIGGPGTGQPSECRDFSPLLFHNPLATFTTRGCPNKCEFCAVPKIEPNFVECKHFRPAPLVCDNNLLACRKKHFERVIDAINIFPVIDFNQGLDARLFTEWHAKKLTELHHVKVRFALDFDGQVYRVYSAVELARYYGLTDIGIYCLIGYNDSPASARARLELVRSWGIRPVPMRYQPLDAVKKNAYIAPGWTDMELRKMVNYYYHLRWYEHIPYEEFNRYPSSDDDDEEQRLFA